MSSKDPAMACDGLEGEEEGSSYGSLVDFDWNWKSSIGEDDHAGLGESVSIEKGHTSDSMPLELYEGPPTSFEQALAGANQQVVVSHRLDSV